MDIFLDGWKKFLLENRTVEAKTDKPDCKSGNKWHDNDGEFSTKSDASSWAGGYDDKGPDCKSGKFKTTGTGTKLMTKHKCGRDDDDGIGKHPYKCKNGEPAFESIDNIEEEIMKIDSAYLAGIIKREVTAALQGIADNNGCSFNDLLKATAAMAQAEKGGPKSHGEK